MKRLNVNDFYELSEGLKPLGGIEHHQGATRRHYVEELVIGRVKLDRLLRHGVIPLRVARRRGEELLEKLKELTSSEDGDNAWLEKEFTAWEVEDLTAQFRAFEAVLLSEWQIADVYLVSKIGAYSTEDLIERADRALDVSVRGAISKSALKDFKQAGRCLAFGLPTAAGFHAMRSTEEVARQWYEHVTSIPAKRRGWNALLKALGAVGADSKTLAVLDQIRRLHRNPLSHPEVFLDMPSAVSLFDIAKSAITAMAAQIQSPEEEN